MDTFSLAKDGPTELSKDRKLQIDWGLGLRVSHLSTLKVQSYPALGSQLQVILPESYINYKTEERT